MLEFFLIASGLIFITTTSIIVILDVIDRTGWKLYWRERERWDDLYKDYLKAKKENGSVKKDKRNSDKN